MVRLAVQVPSALSHSALGLSHFSSAKLSSIDKSRRSYKTFTKKRNYEKSAPSRIKDSLINSRNRMTTLARLSLWQTVSHLTETTATRSTSAQQMIFTTQVELASTRVKVPSIITARIQPRQTSSLIIATRSILLIQRPLLACLSSSQRLTRYPAWPRQASPRTPSTTIYLLTSRRSSCFKGLRTSSLHRS